MTGLAGAGVDDEQKPPGRSRASRLTVGLIIACQSTQAMAVGGIALFLPLIRAEIGLSFTQAGVLGAASTGVYALMQIPAGFLADRFGPKRLFLVGLLGTNLMTVTFAALTSYLPLVVNQAASGFFRSLVFAPGLLLITAALRSDRGATAMGMYVAGGFSSNIILNTVGPFLVEPLGWRTVFVLAASLSLVFVYLFWRLGDPGPTTANVSFRISQLTELLRTRILWLAGVIQFVRLAVVQAFSFWLPTYLVVDKRLSLTAAGLVIAFSGLLTAPANIFGGLISDRLDRPLLVIGTSLSALMVITALLPSLTSLPLVIAAVAVAAVFIQVYFGPLFQLPVQLLATPAVGVTNGFSNFCANLGGLTFAYTLGAVKDATGSFDGGLYALAGLCLVGLAAAGLLALSARSR